MGIAIHLLGAPRVERGGTAVPAPRGHKVWAVLAYLLLADRPPLRTQLATLLFAEADDPLRALRWTLNAIRNLLGDGTVAGDPVELDLPAGTFVDARVLRDATWVEALAIPSLDDDLLDGLHFPTAPTFEAWLLNQRRHLRARAVTALGEGTEARLALSDAEGAVDLATRLVRLEPLSEAHQVLLVRSLATAGDHLAARGQIAAARALFRSELGVEPARALEDAVAVDATVPPAACGLHAILAQIETGEAALGAGAADAGLEYLRLAAAESHVLGDESLQARALLALGSGLVHASRGRQAEGAAALSRALVLADTLDDAALAAKALHHLAWIDYLASQLDAMHEKLDRAELLGVEDPTVGLWGSLTRGMGLLAAARYSDAEQELLRLTTLARRAGESRLLGFGLAVLAGTLAHRGDYAPARQYALEGHDAARASGNLMLIALTQAKRSDIEANDDHPDIGQQLAHSALALGDQIRESPVQTMARTRLGLDSAARGELDSAIAHLASAWREPMVLPDLVWKGALALDALCGVAIRERLPHARGWVADLEALSSRTGMRELLVRAHLHRHRLGDDTAETAARLAAEIDNPLLHAEVLEATGARVSA